MGSKSQNTKSKPTSYQFGLAIGLALSLSGVQACSGQVHKSDIHSSKSKQDGRDAELDKASSKPKSNDSNYGGSETASGSDSGSSPVSPSPSTPTSGGDIDESPTAPQPVTGSPSDGKERVEGQELYNGFYKIRSSYSNKCLLVHMRSLESGAGIVQGNCDDPTAVWKLDYLDNKYYIITNKVTKFSLQIRYQIARSEALLEQGAFRSRDHQKWSVHRQGDGSYLVKPASSDSLCVDISAGSREDNIPIQLWRECHQLGERWEFLEQD